MDSILVFRDHNPRKHFLATVFKPGLYQTLVLKPKEIQNGNVR